MTLDSPQKWTATLWDLPEEQWETCKSVNFKLRELSLSAWVGLIRLVEGLKSVNENFLEKNSASRLYRNSV